MGYVYDRPIDDDSQGVLSTVVVKFRGGTDLPYSDAANAQIRRTNRRAWQQIDRRFAGLILRPFFAEGSERRLRNLSATANRIRREAQVDLTSYFAIDIPDGMDADAVADAVRAMPEVETAYVQLPPPPPPVNDSDDPRAPVSAKHRQPGRPRGHCRVQRPTSVKRPVFSMPQPSGPLG